MNELLLGGLSSLKALLRKWVSLHCGYGCVIARHKYIRCRQSTEPCVCKHFVSLKSPFPTTKKNLRHPLQHTKTTSCYFVISSLLFKLFKQTTERYNSINVSNISSFKFLHHHHIHFIQNIFYLRRVLFFVVTFGYSIQLLEPEKE